MVDVVGRAHCSGSIPGSPLFELWQLNIGGWCGMISLSQKIGGEILWHE